MLGSKKSFAKTLTFQTKRLEDDISRRNEKLGKAEKFLQGRPRESGLVLVTVILPPWLRLPASFLEDNLPVLDEIRMTNSVFIEGSEENAVLEVSGDGRDCVLRAVDAVETVIKQLQRSEACGLPSFQVRPPTETPGQFTISREKRPIFKAVSHGSIPETAPFSSEVREIFEGALRGLRNKDGCVQIRARIGKLRLHEARSDTLIYTYDEMQALFDNASRRNMGSFQPGVDCSPRVMELLEAKFISKRQNSSQRSITLEFSTTDGRVEVQLDDAGTQNFPVVSHAFKVRDEEKCLDLMISNSDRDYDWRITIDMTEPFEALPSHVQELCRSLTVEAHPITLEPPQLRSNEINRFLQESPTITVKNTIKTPVPNTSYELRLSSVRSWDRTTKGFVVTDGYDLDMLAPRWDEVINAGRSSAQARGSSDSSAIDGLLRHGREILDLLHDKKDT